jgi:hypothetical protein
MAISVWVKPFIYLCFCAMHFHEKHYCMPIAVDIVDTHDPISCTYIGTESVGRHKSQ